MDIMSVINFLAEKYYKIAYDTFFYIEDNKKAKKYVSYALNLCPTHVKSLKLKGSIFLLEDKIDLSLEIWKKLYEGGVDDFEVASKIAYCYFQRGEYKNALDFCEKSALKVNLDESEKMYSLYRLKIDLLLSINKVKSALKLFKNALKMLNSQDAYELKNSYSYLNSHFGAVVDIKSIKRAF